MALLSPDEWAAQCAVGDNCTYLSANDMNYDGVVNFEDIGALVHCLIAGECAPPPGVMPPAP